jgi:cellulose synthase/poly-beta-1,6-N-acetylglucosamine synthase-like glycosyltransferase
MSLNSLACVTLVLAAIPCGLFLLNFFVYRPLPHRKSEIGNCVSVLIPARNEEANIRSTLEAV